MQQNCCAERTACGRSDSCVGLIYQCIDQNGCPDSNGTCAQNCRTQFDGGAATFDTLLNCARTQCATPGAGI